MRISLASLLFAAIVLLEMNRSSIAQVKQVTPPPQAAGPATATPAQADETLLKSAHLGSDGAAVLDFFKKRVPVADGDKLVHDLIKQLADKDEAAQHKAAGELVALGPNAVAALRQAANGVEDKAAAARARECLEHIEGEGGLGVIRAAARQLATKKPDGAADALLAYLPYAEGEAVTQEIDVTLGAVGFKEGQPDPALLKALEATHPAIRGVAAAVLCRVGGLAQFGRVRPLLKDEKPAVRLRVALALAARNDPDAVPVLIENLGSLQPLQLKQAEEVLSEIAGDYGIKAPQGNDALSRSLRRELWQVWWKSVDGKAITEELRMRTLSDADLEKARERIKKLADADAKVRDQAVTELVAMGPAVLPLLRKVHGKADAVDVQSAAKCAQLIEKDAPNLLPTAAPRLLVLHQADHAVETLLQYLPFAENEAVVDDIVDLLGVVGFKDGKPNPALVAALNDKVSVRRSAAVLALGDEEWDGQKDALRKLLKDAEPEVRLRAAQTLIGLKDKEGVPEVIMLLAELPPETAWEAEDVLTRLAGSKSPNIAFGADAAAHAKARDAWATWWKQNGDKVDLVKTDRRQRLLGYTLIVEGNSPKGGQGRITEVDANGKVRWQIDTNLQYPTDAQVVANDRVLIAEQNMNRVTERDLTGKIVWEKINLAQPFAVHRERNGNTFIGCRNFLMEVDRNGKEVFSIQRNEYLLGAMKLRNGEIAFVSNVGQYTRIDSTGKELKVVHIPQQVFGINFAEPLPNDHVMIVTQLNQPACRIIEFDADGKQVWEANLQAIGAPSRLPNGHTLVPVGPLNRGTIVELDRNGKTVAELKDLNYRPVRVSRR
jgi:HEAT repeat protein